MKSQDDQEQLGSIQKSGHASSAIMNDRKDTISTGTQPTTNRETFLLSADDAICEKTDALKVSKNLPYQIFGKPEKQDDQCQNLPIARMGTNISISTKKDAETVTSALTNTSETSEQWTNRVIKNLPVKPYYSHNGIIIINSDCREILPHLPKVDLVLTDPPYGIDYQSAWRIDWQRKEKIHGDDNFPLWIFEELKPNVALMVWCRWDQLSIMPKPKSFIAWDKGNHSMGDLKHEFGRRWEACAFYPGPQHAFKRRPADLIIANRVNPLSQLHPNEKPVEAITPLIECHEGETVLDPFMGSGTTLRAAKDLGRKAIGIEIEEKYCEIAARRLSQEVFNFTVDEKVIAKPGRLK